MFGFFVALVAGALPVGEALLLPTPAPVEAPQSEPADEPATTAVTKRVQANESAAGLGLVGVHDVHNGTGREHDSDGARNRRSSRHPAGIAGSQRGSSPRTGASSTSGYSLRGESVTLRGEKGVDLHRRRGERGRDCERPRSRDPVRNGRAGPGPCLRSAEAGRWPARASKRRRGRACVAPSCCSPIRVLDRAREPHEGLCET